VHAKPPMAKKATSNIESGAQRSFGRIPVSGSIVAWASGPCVPAKARVCASQKLTGRTPGPLPAPARRQPFRAWIATKRVVPRPLIGCSALDVRCSMFSNSFITQRLHRFEAAGADRRQHAAKDANDK